VAAHSEEILDGILDSWMCRGDVKSQRAFTASVSHTAATESPPVRPMTTSPPLVAYTPTTFSVLSGRDERFPLDRAALVFSTANYVSSSLLFHRSPVTVGIASGDVIRVASLGGQYGGRRGKEKTRQTTLHPEGNACREKPKLDIEQTQIVLLSLRKDVRLIVMVALFCTLRISEVLGLQCKHLTPRRRLSCRSTILAR
jgi:hypothetical protein